MIKDLTILTLHSYNLKTYNLKKGHKGIRSLRLKVLRPCGCVDMIKDLTILTLHSYNLKTYNLKTS